MQTALAEVDTEKATTGSVTTVQTNLDNHTGDTSDAHDASAISIADSANQYTATNAEDALAEVLDGLQAHEADASDAHDASAISFSPTGTVAATNVQSAIAEVASEASGGYRTLITAGSDVSNATTTFADITGLSFAVTADTNYRYYALIVYTTSTGNAGAAFAANGPTVGSGYGATYARWGGTTHVTQSQGNHGSYDLNAVSTAHGSQSTFIAVIEGFVRAQNSGTLAMRFKSDGDGTIVVKAGSTLEVW